MTPLQGIDVSAHNGTFSTDGQAFVFIRACYGSGKDTKFDEHLATAKAAGVVTGAYCFGRNMDPILQASRLLEIAPDVDFLFLDYENDAGHPHMTSDQAKAFIRDVQTAGRKIGLYASESGYPANAFGADYRWVANYSRQPVVPFQFWQYQGSPLDRSRFYGTKTQLLALAGHPAAPTPSGDPMTNLVPITAHRVVDLKAGTVLQQTPGGTTFTTLKADATLALLGATATHYHVADGDSGVYVVRPQTVRTADKNVGA